ncbi:unnamed protein product [Ceutorhynchus assimilis]|uniref:RNB domain-containing protein n=1 Tax=Ceutorhynchus assimilis TaxID=467358 RepID=A0A9P0DEC0_9CUCU|nr:unnamed protein product [Ceutorhynchus assimilis]
MFAKLLLWKLFKLSCEKYPKLDLFNTAKYFTEPKHSVSDSSKKRNRRRIRKPKNKPEPTPSPSTSRAQLFPKSSPFLSQKTLEVGNYTTTKIAASIPKQLIQEKFVCDIYPVKKPTTGKLFRKRSTKFKFVNLRSFLGAAKTCVFVTVKIFTNNDKSFSKMKRKYFDSVVSNNHDELSMTENANNHSISAQEDTNDELRQEHATPNKKKTRFRPKKHKLYKSERKLAKADAIQSFPPTLSEEEAKIATNSKEFVRGFIRINPKNARDSYISNIDSSLPDYHVTSIADRNTALDGDEVLLKLKPQSEWLEGKPTAYVVYIVNKIHPRIAVGHLKNAGGSVKFLPRDKRMPVMDVPLLTCPKNYKKNPKVFENVLFAAQLLEWSSPHECSGIITETLGIAGDLRVETTAILKEFCLDITPFTPEMVQYLPKTKAIPDKELEYREDLRKSCIFTIDPLTARDLDDAVSVKELPNGHYEVGVHISDASYYLPEGTNLDKMVSKKATTIYLVDSVYHMLPVELCLHCSLLPGEDKLAFSVFWEMDEQGQIFSTRFSRTIVNSCSQLAYEHAQQMIENPTKEFDLPPIFNGFSAKDLSKTVNVLQKIAVNLREARIKNGSLRIDQTKLLFSLNPGTGEPDDFIVYENKESHRLIEEFMLLANISVAEQIRSKFPDIAFLRCHDPPKQTMLVVAQKNLETCGINIDVTSSGSIHDSLRKYITDDYKGYCRGIVLNQIFAKAMTRARYFCSGTMADELGYSHYALSVPIYTHFTSPIRRYADIMVHRLLAASLDYSDEPNWSKEDVISIAANCNAQKYQAKRAGEASSDLYLAHYIDKRQPFIQDCVVVDVKDRSFDAIVLKTGSMIRVYQNTCQDNPSWKVEAIPLSSPRPVSQKPEFGHEKKVLRLTLDFPISKKVPETLRMVVEMFSVVTVQLKRVPNTYRLEAHLLRPLPTKVFERANN